jgi:hypothetical protein
MNVDRHFFTILLLPGLLLAFRLVQSDVRPEQACGHRYAFSLTVDDHHREERTSFPDLDPLSIEFESELRLFGGVCEQSEGDQLVFTIHDDSLLFRSLKPLRFTTFMSGDTLRYASQEGPNFIDRSYTEAHDSMLACLFGGPALKICKKTAEAGLEINLLNKDCQSGEYTRLDPVSAFGLFFSKVRPAALKKGYRWRERKSCPDYSGLYFRPDIRLTERVVQSADGEATAVLTSDTTFTDVQIILPNGETATLLSKSLRVGGTVVMAAGTGLPLRGEVRIEEHVRYLRPRLGEKVLEKEGSFILRWRCYRLSADAP